MGNKISVLYNCVCNQRCSKQSSRSSILFSRNEEELVTLPKPLGRWINYFDIWTTSKHDVDLILVWLDEQIDIDLDTTTHMKVLMKKINERILLFSNINRFFKFLETLTNETIFLIISGRASTAVLPRVNNKEQIHAVYIFCIRDDDYKNLSNSYSKLRGVFNSHKELLLGIQQDINIYIKHLIKLNALSTDEQHSITDLSLESPLFLWSYLMKDILINTNKTDDAKQVMLTYCRSQYELGDPMLRQIDEFEKTYKADDAIKWYTKDSFVYRLVNKLIRTENINGLLHFKFFIIDLSNCLRTKWEENSNQRSQGSITVYRGAHLTNAELEKLKPDSLISPNGYFSTSGSFEMACIYAVNTIFVIEIDPSVGNLIFANIAEYSQFPEEEEILFDLGCVFKIISVVYDELNQRSIIKMVGVDENEGEKVASDFIKMIKDTKKTSGYLDGLIDDFVHKIGHEQGIRLYEHFLRLPTVNVKKIIDNCSRFLHIYEKYCDASNVTILYGCFGWFFTQKAEYDLAIEYCTRALTSVEKKSSYGSITIEIAMIHNTIGWSYYEKGEYNYAFDWCQKAREILKKCAYVEDSKYVKVLRSEGNLTNSPPRNDIEFAEILTNIGCIYYKKNDFNLANFYCNESMNILKQFDSEIIFDSHYRTKTSNNEIDNHYETIAANYEVFADIYYNEKNYVLALEFYQKAQEIFETITPRIPICLQRSPFIFGRNKQRLQNSIRITEQKLNSSSYDGTSKRESDVI
jgi:tetratricopeptide (TPR) repeat protein